MDKQNVRENSSDKTPSGLDGVVQDASAHKNGIICSHCWAHFENINDMYHCPKHPETLVHTGECGHCTQLGCKLPAVPYLGERSRENIEQRISVLGQERQTISASRQERQTLFESLRRRYFTLFDYIYAKSIDILPLIAVGCITFVFASAMHHVAVVRPERLYEKRLYERHFESCQGQVLQEEYRPSDKTTQEYYRIQLQDVNGTKYTLNITPSSRVSLGELEEKVRVGSWVSFPWGNMSKEGMKNFTETVFFNETMGSDLEINKTKGFKPADRITILDEKR